MKWYDRGMVATIWEPSVFKKVQIDGRSRLEETICLTVGIQPAYIPSLHQPMTISEQGKYGPALSPIIELANNGTE